MNIKDPMYTDNTVAGMSKEGATVRQKADAYDAINQQNRERHIYDTGASNAYTNVEQALAKRAEQAAMRQQADAGLAASIQQNMRQNAYNRALAQAQQDDNMSEDYINLLVERELSKSGGF